jgi:hypothetical protein
VTQTSALLVDQTRQTWRIYLFYIFIYFIYFISSPTKVRIIATSNVAVYIPHSAYVNVQDEIAPGVRFLGANVANTDWIKLHF